MQMPEESAANYKMCIPLPNVVAYVLHCERRDGRVVDCGCLENSWVNSPGGSNPSPSVKRSAAFLFAGEFAVHVILRHGLSPWVHRSQGQRSVCRMLRVVLGWVVNSVTLRYARAVQPAGYFETT
jgi:hypothetical protein